MKKISGQTGGKVVVWVMMFFSFLPAVGNRSGIFTDQDPFYFVMPAMPVNQVHTGDMLAVTRDIQVQQARVLSGKLPAGMQLLPNGFILVAEERMLKEGMYRLQVETTDQLHRKMKHSISVSLLPESAADHKAAFVLSPARSMSMYQKGDMLGRAVDPDGEIIDMVLIRGSLPPGMVFRHDGKVLVDNPQDLQEGNFTIWLAVADQQKGISMLVVSINLKQS